MFITRTQPQFLAKLRIAWFETRTGWRRQRTAA
jgi:hypothetical protein